MVVRGSIGQLVLFGFRVCEEEIQGWENTDRDVRRYEATHLLQYLKMGR